MSNAIGHRDFVGGSRLPVYRDAQGQYVFGDFGEKVYGVWILDPDALGEDPEPPAADPSYTVCAPRKPD